MVEAARPAVFRLKQPQEIEVMHRAGRILGACLDAVAGAVRPGITTADLDGVADGFIRDHGCIPGFLGYRGFPKSICISVNEEAVHGIPGPRVLRDGDLVSLDCGLILEGWWADSGMTVVCGTGDPELERLIAVTRAALYLGIAQARAGNHIGDIGHAVQAHVEANGFSIVRDYGGHGIGRNMHEPPHVPNHAEPGTGNLLKPGYVLAIEPIVNAGRPEVVVEDDGWTVVAADGKNSCYSEHTVAITESGPVVLTAREGEVIDLGRVAA